MLRDERDVWTMVLQAFTRGAQGRRATLRDLGKDPDAIIEEQLQKAEEGLNDVLLPPPTGFTISPGRPAGSRDGSARRATGGEPRTVERKRTLGAAHEHDHGRDELVAEDEIPEGLWEYYEEIEGHYRSMAEAVAERADGDDEAAVAAAISAGFGAMAGVLDGLVEDVFRGYEVAAPEKTRSGLLVQTWNGRYIYRFMTQMVARVQALRSKLRGRPEELREQVLALFDVEKRRLPLYILDGAHKARNAARLASAKAKFVTVVTAGDDKVCEECAANEGARMTVDEFLAEYPKHPRCRCVGVEAE